MMAEEPEWVDGKVVGGWDSEPYAVSQKIKR